MALDKTMLDVDENDVDQHVLFDSSQYPNGTSASLYMTLPSSPPRNRTHGQEYQKKKDYILIKQDPTS